MIQEKDFLYRVPVKTAPITTPGGQIRNPEILVDIEGGEFMHGNILDANSTNKLINQSVDDKITEGGYVTKNLLDAETARATAKENQIKAQVDIINGDSTTEGSFRKAIADVVAAAPEDLDTLKEIADKLAGNDDLHTALNQAITEKADASALLNEVARATGVENNLKATLVNYALNSDVEEKLAQKADTTMLSEFIDKTSTEEQAINSPLHTKEYISVFHNTAYGASGIKITNSGILAIDQLNENASPNKVFATDGSIADLSQYADATALSNYVLTTALNQQVDTLNAAISAKQDAGNYIPYDASQADTYWVDKTIAVKANAVNTAVFGPNSCIMLKSGDTNTANISYSTISLKTGDYSFTLDPSKITQVGVGYAFDVNTSEGVKFSKGESFAKITPLGFFSNQNDAAFTVCNANDFIHIKSLVDQVVRVQPTSLYCSNGTSSIDINSTGISLTDDDNNIRLSRSGVFLPDGNSNYVLTSAGSTINIAEYATKSDLSSQINPKADRSDLIALEKKITANTTAIEGKQDKGNYVTYNSKDDDGYYFDKFFTLNDGQLAVFDGTELKTTITGVGIGINSISDNEHVEINAEQASFVSDNYSVSYGSNGINSSKYAEHIPITDGSFRPISDFALTTDLHNVIRANNVVDGFYELDNALKIGSEAEGFLTIRNSTISSSANGRGFVLNWHGLTFEGRRENNEVPTTDGSFISLNNYVLKSEYNKKITALEARIAALEAKHQEAA